MVHAANNDAVGVAAAGGGGGGARARLVNAALIAGMLITGRKRRKGFYARISFYADISIRSCFCLICALQGR